MPDILKIPTDSLTDLIGGVILIPLIILLLTSYTDKKTEKKYWIGFFVFLALSSIDGFLTHYYCTGQTFKNMWILLYPLLFETVDFFFLAALAIRTDGRMPDKKTNVILQSVSFAVTLVTVLLEVIPGYNMIRVFTFYGIIIGLSGFALIVPSAFARKNVGSIMIFCALVPLLPAAYLQVERKTVIHIAGIEFNHNAITHVFIIISEIILCAAAIKRLKKIKNKMSC